jgi:hypothetical protein
MFARLVQSLWENLRNKVIYARPAAALQFLTSIAAEFQASILACITQIANCLTDDYWTVCQAGATTLVKLSKKGAISFCSIRVCANSMTAEFREAVRAFIPRIMDLLKNNHPFIRQVGAHTMANLWKQGRILLPS